MSAQEPFDYLTMLLSEPTFLDSCSSSIQSAAYWQQCQPNNLRTDLTESPAESGRKLKQEHLSLETRASVRIRPMVLHCEI